MNSHVPELARLAHLQRTTHEVRLALEHLKAAEITATSANDDVRASRLRAIRLNLERESY